MATNTAAKRTEKKPAKKATPDKAATKPRKASAASRKQALAPERIEAILDLLAAAYPKAECALIHKDAWQLLVATILSAQCTDARVNMVTPVLFKRFPTPADLAAAPIEEIKEIIRTTGFYNNKAKSIQGAAKKIIADFNGKVPRKMEELLTVPGAARKTANVVLGVAYGSRRRSRRRHPRPTPLPTPRADHRNHARKSRAGPNEDHPAGPLDRVFPRIDPPRKKRVYCPQAAVRRLHTRENL